MGKDCVYPRALARESASASRAGVEESTVFQEACHGHHESSAPLLLMDPALSTWDVADISTLLNSSIHASATASASSIIDCSRPLSPPIVNRTVAAAISNLQPRIEYASRRIAIQAAILVETGRNVFIHRSQVVSSSALRDALSASALYAVRNDANAAIVHGEIAQRAAQLIEAVESALLHWPLVQVDLLPSVQALLIYQILRLFAGCGTTQRAQAERDAAILRSWLSKLYLKLKHIPDNISSDQSWDQWIEEESTRRTIVFAEAMQGVHVFLRQEWDGVSQCFHDLEFTAQVALWQAESAIEWRCAGSNSLVFPVNLKSYQRDLLEATPADLDDLGVMLRGMWDDLESLESWLGGNRQVLQKWGLRDHGNLGVICY